MTETLVLPRALERMRRGRRASHAALVGAFAAGIVGFGGVALYSEMRLRRVDARLDAIADEAMPSIVTLATLRSDLVDLGFRVEEELRAPTGQTPALTHAIEDLRRSLRRYEALLAPMRDVATRETGDAVEEAIAELEAVRDRLSTQEVADANARFEHDARPKLARASSMLGSLMQLRADDASSLARRAEDSRTHTARIALGLDGVMVAAACLVALLALRAVRRDARALEERAAELEAFADRVAHDVRGPVGAALLSLTLAEQDVRDRPKALDTLARGERSLRVVTSLVNDLLAFAGASAAPESSARTNVQHAVHDVLVELRPKAEAARVTLTVEPFDRIDVACAPGVAASIFGNLIRNAITHMGRGEPRRVDVRVARRGRETLIDVADTGPGIDDTDLERIFRPHVRGAGTGGLGLGLATVKRLVQSHGGRIAVRHRRGGGSVFQVALPIAGERGARPDS